MPSPFPGMNPYLETEDAWQDFHHSLIQAIRDALTGQIRPDYIAKIEERLYIHELSAEERGRYLGNADVSVTDLGDATRPAMSVAVVDAPVTGEFSVAIDIERSGYVEILDRQTRELVTVIELLSPTNKRRGADREQFLAKRRQILFSTAHYVEIDLLRGGPRLPVEGLPACDYYAAVSRVEDRPRVGLWPLNLREPLPTLPVPLRAPHADAKLPLQELLHKVYDAAGYADYVYGSPPQPPLRDEDAAWAGEIVRRPVSTP